MVWMIGKVSSYHGSMHGEHVVVRIQNLTQIKVTCSRKTLYHGTKIILGITSCYIIARGPFICVYHTAVNYWYGILFPRVIWWHFVFVVFIAFFNVTFFNITWCHHWFIMCIKEFAQLLSPHPLVRLKKKRMMSEITDLSTYRDIV